MEPIDTLLTALQDLTNQWAEVSGRLEAGGYDRMSPRAAIANASIAALHFRIHQLHEIVLACQEPNPSAPSAEILAAFAPALQTPVVAARDQIQAIHEQLRPHTQANLRLRDTNNNFSIEGSVDGSAVFTLDLSGHFKRLSQNLTEALRQAATVLALCRPQGMADLTQRAEAFSAVLGQAERAKGSIEEISATIKSRDQAATESQKALTASVQTAEQLLQKIQAVEAQATKDAAQSNQQVAQINAISASANTLQQQVSGYSSAFEAFQKQLETRNQQFTDFERRMNEFDGTCQEHEKEMRRLIDKADSMIRGATTAGLSDSLERTADEYKRRTVAARRMFNLSILILAVCAIPLAAHLFPGLLPESWLADRSDARDVSVLDSLLGRILLLAPATWMTWFYSKSFSEFFHLEREYTHKATLAKTVEGFKREDPDHAGDIAAAVFGEVLSNPASRQSPEPANHPFAETFSKRLSEILRKAKNKP